MEELNKFEVAADLLPDLPLFYNYIYYNEIALSEEVFTPGFSETLSSYISYYAPDKPISQIIDFTKIRLDHDRE